MRQRILTAPLVAMCLTCPVLAEPLDKPADREPSVARMLERRVDQVEWDGVPFHDVVTWLREQGAGNVIVKWRALEVIGADATTPITLSLRDVTVGAVLREALSQLGGDEGGTDPVRFHRLDGLLTISTRSDFNRQLLTRVYDVTDLILPVPNFTDGPILDLQETGGGQGAGADGAPKGGQGNGGDDPTGPGPGNAPGGEYAAPLDTLINVIKATIEPDTWEIAGNPAWSAAAGGGKGTIVPYRRTLVVRNTLEVHEQLGGILR